MDGGIQLQTRTRQQVRALLSCYNKGDLCHNSTNKPVMSFPADISDDAFILKIVPKVPDPIRAFKYINLYSLMWHVGEDRFQVNIKVSQVGHTSFVDMYNKSQMSAATNEIWQYINGSFSPCLIECWTHLCLAKHLTWSGLGYRVRWQDGETTEACSLPAEKDQWHLNLISKKWFQLLLKQVLDLSFTQIAAGPKRTLIRTAF